MSSHLNLTARQAASASIDTPTASAPELAMDSTPRPLCVSRLSSSSPNLPARGGGGGGWGGGDGGGGWDVGWVDHPEGELGRRMAVGCCWFCLIDSTRRAAQRSRAKQQGGRAAAQQGRAAGQQGGSAPPNTLSPPLPVPVGSPPCSGHGRRRRHGGGVSRRQAGQAWAWRFTFLLSRLACEARTQHTEQLSSAQPMPGQARPSQAQDQLGPPTCTVEEGQPPTTHPPTHLDHEVFDGAVEQRAVVVACR